MTDFESGMDGKTSVWVRTFLFLLIVAITIISVFVVMETCYTPNETICKDPVREPLSAYMQCVADCEAMGMPTEPLTACIEGCSH